MTKTADKFGRVLKYLRISVTDRCNFRCRYCMPNNTFAHIESDKILRYEDILFAAEVFASMGVNRVRITGGEPLVRKNIVEFLGNLAKISGISEIMLTTNASLLPKFGADIFSAGVKRLNISLDSLREDRNKFITGSEKFTDTINGIKLASSLGFSPIKVNVVVINGFNDDELGDFCKFSADNGVIVRFIEFMPIGNSPDWGAERIITGSAIIKSIERFEPILLEKDENSGPAENYKLNNGGIIGIITPMSRHFCGDCDKLRLTADGKIRPCLLSDNEINLTDVLKARDRAATAELIERALNVKSIDHGVELVPDAKNFKRTMSKIGG